MPYPAYMRFTYKDQVEKTDLTVCGEENLVQINEFHWDIGHKEIISPFSYDWQAVHSPFKVVMEVNRLLPLLYKLKCSCDTDYFDQIEVFWVEFDPKKSQDSIYFKHTFEPVKIWNIRLLYNNVKSPDFERNGHLVEIDFRYRYATILHVDGFLEVGKYEWKLWLVEFDDHGDLSPEEVEHLLTCPAATDDAIDEIEALLAQQKLIGISNPKWQHQTDQKREESPDYVSEGDKIQLSVDISGMDEGEEVSFRVIDQGSDTNQVLAFVTGVHSGGKSTVEWTVDLSKVQEKPKAQLAFNANGRGAQTGDCAISLAQQGWGTIAALDEEPIPDLFFAVLDEELKEIQAEYSDTNGLIPVPFAREDGHTVFFRQMEIEYNG